EHQLPKLRTRVRFSSLALEKVLVRAHFWVYTPSRKWVQFWLHPAFIPRSGTIRTFSGLFGGVQYDIERLGDDPIPALSGVLVSLSSRRRRVPQPGHNLTQSGARLGGERAGGVAKVVEVQLRVADGLAGQIPLLIERRSA